MRTARGLKTEQGGFSSEKQHGGRAGTTPYRLIFFLQAWGRGALIDLNQTRQPSGYRAGHVAGVSNVRTLQTGGSKFGPGNLCSLLFFFRVSPRLTTVLPITSSPLQRWRLGTYWILI